VREHNLEGGRPPCDWDDPADIDRLVSELVDDANELVWAADELDLDEPQADAVALLALVAGQDVEPGDGPGRWRIAQRTAPDRVSSTVDPESRHAHKTNHAYRDGFKAHLAAEPDTGLICGFDLTGGNTSDAQTAPGLLEDEPEGTEVLGDSAYGTGELRAHLADRQMTAVIKPPPLRPAVEGGYTLDDFDIDEPAGTITCPAGITVTITPARIGYFKRHCDGCRLRHRCTTAAGGRTITLHPHHGLLAAARAQACTDEFQDPYRRHRPMIERTIAWLVARNNRRLRYRGIERNRLWLAHRAAAINLRRLINLGLTHHHTWTTA
jgi:IS5 family transposase